MDGNRRWAKKKNLPAVAGHEAGREKLKEVAEWAMKAGVKNLIAFAFSTENWNRSKQEVDFLMDLMEKTLDEGLSSLTEKNVRITFIGDRSHLSPKIQELIGQVEKESRGNSSLTLTLAVSYGSKAELVRAVARALSGLPDNKPLTETILNEALDTKDIPDPDMIIRTSGEKRLSNFLLWQAAYSELFFTDTLWPDFSEEEFLGMIKEYENRERRRGV